MQQQRERSTNGKPGSPAQPAAVGIRQSAQITRVQPLRVQTTLATGLLFPSSIVM